MAVRVTCGGMWSVGLVWRVWLMWLPQSSPTRPTGRTTDIKGDHKWFIMIPIPQGPLPYTYLFYIDAFVISPLHYHLQPPITTLILP